MKRRLAPLVLLGLTAALCWLVAELVVARAGLLEYAPSMNRGHPTRGYTLRAGYEGESAYGIPFRVSAQGFRSPEVAVPKPAGTKRVLLLGDSVTWGAGVREEETFARRLERSLGAELACPVEVVNTGVSGYGTIEELDVLEQEGLAFEPDVVVVYHVENDNVTISHAQGPFAALVKDRIVYRSYLIGAALQAYRNARWRLEAARAGGETVAYTKTQLAWDERPGTEPSLAALRRIAALAREHGARGVLASHWSVTLDPSADARRNGILRAIADETGMRFVDVGEGLGDARRRDLAVSRTDRHPNGFAHERIAELLRPAVRDALGCPLRAGAPS